RASRAAPEPWGAQVGGHRQARDASGSVGPRPAHRAGPYDARPRPEVPRRPSSRAHPRARRLWPRIRGDLDVLSGAAGRGLDAVGRSRSLVRRRPTGAPRGGGGRAHDRWTGGPPGRAGRSGRAAGKGGAAPRRSGDRGGMAFALVWHPRCVDDAKGQAMTLDPYHLALGDSSQLKLRASAMVAEGGAAISYEAALLFHE